MPRLRICGMHRQVQTLAFITGMKAGITGGLGCGKSTAARMLEARGFRRLDSDQIVRDQVLVDPEVVAAIRARYGDGVLQGMSDGGKEGLGEGETRGNTISPSLRPSVFLSAPAREGETETPKINRAALAKLVFADDTERLWLEELTHPRVFAARRAAFAAAPNARWAVEVPLLFEKGLENWFDFTICVACAPDLQLARLEQRGLPRVLAGQRISKQLPLARKIELSDFVLWNEGSPEFLEAQIDRLADALVAA
jgi:dephospho-CoA kinase